MPSSHDEIIAAAAKQALQPLGFCRKGRSRTWLADHGWWLTIAEFQPSGWSKGSYLNVGAHWLWSTSGHLSFDFGNRVAQFEAYDSDAQFARSAEMLADKAATRSRELVQTFPSVAAAATVLVSRLVEEPGGSWPSLNAGIVAGLADRGEDAARLLRSVSDPRASPVARSLLAIVQDPVQFRCRIDEFIANQRRALRLSAVYAPLI